MSAKDSNPNRRADLTRKAILRAAIREFSNHGLAGARTDAIAESAKVNKALLYYYFKSKTGLYAAAIKEVSTSWQSAPWLPWIPNTAQENACYVQR